MRAWHQTSCRNQCAPNAKNIRRLSRIASGISRTQCQQGDFRRAAERRASRTPRFCRGCRAHPPRDESGLVAPSGCPIPRPQRFPRRRQKTDQQKHPSEDKQKAGCGINGARTTPIRPGIWRGLSGFLRLNGLKLPASLRGRRTFQGHGRWRKSRFHIFLRRRNLKKLRKMGIFHAWVFAVWP